mmetsp:Transcript_55730/g.66977  ORF Transcript_55730/g.66977 Transcript_55730/m.66977 type:complete len:130 (+) Transcript_55730:188-577(+)
MGRHWRAKQMVSWSRWQMGVGWMNWFVEDTAIGWSIMWKMTSALLAAAKKKIFVILKPGIGFRHFAEPTTICCCSRYCPVKNKLLSKLSYYHGDVKHHDDNDATMRVGHDDDAYYEITYSNLSLSYIIT